MREDRELSTQAALTEPQLSPRSSPFFLFPAKTTSGQDMIDAIEQVSSQARQAECRRGTHSEQHAPQAAQSGLGPRWQPRELELGSL
jgi:hypothetical protein